MLLDWKLTESQFNRLPRHERQEMLQFYSWRHELKQRIEEKDRMQSGRGGVSG